MGTFPSFVPQKLRMFQNNTQLIQIFGLRDSTGAFISTATITATLLDQNRNEVANCIGISLLYITSSNGNYQGSVSAAFEPPVGTEYTLIIDGDSGGSHIHMEIPTEVRPRSS